jgi:hypothetical protein
MELRTSGKVIPQIIGWFSMARLETLQSAFHPKPILI